MLQKRVLEAEAAVSKLEEEKTALRVLVEQHENRLLEYQAKVKSIEEMWEMKIASLQVSLNSLMQTCFHKCPNILLTLQHVHLENHCECGQT